MYRFNGVHAETKQILPTVHKETAVSMILVYTRRQVTRIDKIVYTDTIKIYFMKRFVTT